MKKQNLSDDEIFLRLKSEVDVMAKNKDFSEIKTEAYKPKAERLKIKRTFAAVVSLAACAAVVGFAAIGLNKDKPDTEPKTTAGSAEDRRAYDEMNGYGDDDPMPSYFDSQYNYPRDTEDKDLPFTIWNTGQFVEKIDAKDLGEYYHKGDEEYFWYRINNKFRLPDIITNFDKTKGKVFTLMVSDGSLVYRNISDEPAVEYELDDITQIKTSPFHLPTKTSSERPRADLFECLVPEDPKDGDVVVYATDSGEEFCNKQFDKNNAVDPKKEKPFKDCLPLDEKKPDRVSYKNGKFEADFSTDYAYLTFVEVDYEQGTVYSSRRVLLKKPDGDAKSARAVIDISEVTDGTEKGLIFAIETNDDPYSVPKISAICDPSLYK